MRLLIHTSVGGAPTFQVEVSKHPVNQLLDVNERGRLSGVSEPDLLPPG